VIIGTIEILIEEWQTGRASRHRQLIERRSDARRPR